MKSVAVSFLAASTDLGEGIGAAYVRFVSWLSASTFCLWVRFAILFVITTSACRWSFDAGSRYRLVQWAVFTLAGICALAIPLESLFAVLSCEQFTLVKALVFTLALFAALALPRFSALFLTPCLADQRRLTIAFYAAMAILWLLTLGSNVWKTWGSP